MALYAFDGTGSDWMGENIAKNTNVARFLEYYGNLETANVSLAVLSDDEEYIAGIGTRLGPLGKLFGGFNGAGGRTRVRELIRHFEQNWLRGDSVIDVIGFSRGAALALHFCNALADGIDINGTDVHPSVRFLGLWDTVPAFGLPGILIDAFHPINLGWRLNIPANVKKCCHALALDENRQAFQVHRPKVLNPATPGQENGTVLEELWFRGVHSDVGGGNGQTGLSSIPLHWMLDCAEKCGAPVSKDVLKTIENRWRPESCPHRNKFGGEQERRQPRPGDRFHSTAAEPLVVGNSLNVAVKAANPFNVFPLLVEAGAEYVFQFDPGAIWIDQDILCTASGWPDPMPDKPGILDNIKWTILKSYFFSHFRRVPRANWFELVACIDYDLETAVPVGCGQFSTPESPWRPSRTGRLAMFANDAAAKYDNNDGVLSVTIRRTR